MSLLAAFRSLVLSHPEVTDEIGDRLHAEFVPEQSERPNAYFTVISSAPVMRVDGKPTLYRYRIQIGCRGRTAMEAEGVSYTIRKAIEHGSGGGITKVLHLGRLPGSWDPQLRTYAADDDYAVWWTQDQGE
ncbi:MAG: hypothetical protein EA417_01800 [Gammaproteobacteria bacterium]|nr:MAG: hypothetical protein EA417_01800 [Gammaproteobacteria bacterium]